MRFEHEVQDYAARIKFQFNAEECERRAERFRACIPFDFWEVRDSEVTHNRGAWERYVLPYCRALTRARRYGYGLHFEGANGVGKTMFASAILSAAIEANYAAYYTTVLDLTFDLQRGMGNRDVMDRMDELLQVDFLVLDELTKEQYKGAGDSWMRTHVERVLKFRHDNNLPTIVATNADLDGVTQAYGSTVRSVLSGKYQHVLFDAGDFRDKLHKRMRDEMGYDG